MSNQLQKRISLAGALNPAINLLLANKKPVTLETMFEAAAKIVEKLDQVAPVTEEAAPSGFKRKNLSGGSFFDEQGRVKAGKKKGVHVSELDEGYLSWLRGTDRKEELEALLAKVKNEDNNEPY